MLIRTTRPCAIAGRDIPPGLIFALPEPEAEALVEAGAAEPWEPLARAPAPNPYAAPTIARAGQE